MYPSCRSERTKAFNVRRTVRFVLAAVVFSRVPAEPPIPGGPPAVPCAAASPRVVRLLVVNEAGVAPAALDAAVAEAGAIWTEAGVRLDWTFAPASFQRTDDDTVVLVIRRALRTPPAPGGTAPSPSHALGRVSFAVDGRPANMIEVSLDAVTSLVMSGSQFDRPIPTLPLVNRLAMVGRGLGRVVAHELGHWLAGRGHVPFGVMKAGFRLARPCRVDHAAVAARVEGPARRGGACPQPAMRAGGRALRKGPMPPDWRHRATRAGPQAGARQ